ncbi:ABC transporter ATP-binding protein, partial [Streptomyces anulatus]
FIKLPPLILSDYQNGAMYAAAGHNVSTLITDLNAEGQTIVVVTHDLDLAEACTSRTVRIADGRISEDVRPSSVAPEAVR